MAKIKIAPSILAADFCRLEEEILEVQAFSESIHVDVMDGHFVPNISIGPVVSNSVKKSKTITAPLSIHLMISNPGRYAFDFLTDPEDKIIFHRETTDRPKELIKRIKERGSKVGISQKPEGDPRRILPLLPLLDEVLVMGVEPGFGGQKFMPETLERINWLSQQIKKQKLEVRIGVDGGMNPRTVGKVVAAGADIIIAGSAIFGENDRVQAIKNLKRAAIEGTDDRI